MTVEQIYEILDDHIVKMICRADTLNRLHSEHTAKILRDEANKLRDLMDGMQKA